jgi:RNA polymerase sigma-70 factor (ECF subfamily)
MMATTKCEARGTSASLEQPEDAASDAGTGSRRESALSAEDLRDPLQFERLYECHRALVYHYMLSQTGSRETAEDLTSQSFLRALGAFPHFIAGRPFLPWLMRIAHNTLVDHRRATTRGQRLVALLKSLRAEQAYVQPEDELAGFLSLTSGLPKTQGDALALRFLVGLELAEVAAVLGRSRNATRMLLFRALSELRARAEREDWS